MRQTIAFQATGFDCSPVQVEIDENGEAPDPDALPVALLAFESGPNSCSPSRWRPATPRT